jgi:WXG100 family type VII secretion target
MAGQVTVNRAAMVTAAQQVESALGEIRAQQTRLVGTHDTLQGGWQGEASTAFTNAFNEFNSDFAIVISALDGIHARLVGGHANYNTVESANTTTAGKIASALNR